MFAAPASKAAAKVPSVNASLTSVLFTVISRVRFLIAGICSPIQGLIVPLRWSIAYRATRVSTTSYARMIAHQGKSFSFRFSAPTQPIPNPCGFPHEHVQTPPKDHAAVTLAD